VGQDEYVVTNAHEDTPRYNAASQAASSKKHQKAQKPSPARQKTKRKHAKRSVPNEGKPMTKTNWKAVLTKKVVAGVIATAISFFSDNATTNSAP
jgi:hypothetical protein